MHNIHIILVVVLLFLLFLYIIYHRQLFEFFELTTTNFYKLKVNYTYIIIPYLHTLHNYIYIYRKPDYRFSIIFLKFFNIFFHLLTFTITTSTLYTLYH